MRGPRWPAAQLRRHRPGLRPQPPLRGAIFENWVYMEKLKQRRNADRDAPFYFSRDQKGHEVDLVEDHGTSLYPTEIKSSVTGLNKQGA